MMICTDTDVMKNTLRILSIYQTAAVNQHSDISAILCGGTTAMCVHENKSTLLARARNSLFSHAGTEPLTVCAVPVSRAPANTLNPMWFLCRCWLWYRRTGLAQSAWSECSPAGRMRWGEERGHLFFFLNSSIL